MVMHNNHYCSDEDVRRKRCTAAQLVPIEQQNADLNAGSLLTPANGSTYSEKEGMAAKDFVTMVTNPVPKEMLQVSLEKGPGGAAYVFESMAAAARMSVANYSLLKIWAENSPDDSLSAAGGATPGDAISMVGVMKSFVYDRFAKPDWNKSLSTMDTNGLLKEVAMLMAGQNWMDYRAYLQAERMEAVAATQLAIITRDSNEKRLNAMAMAMPSKR
jgi:hypothetical protein